MRIEDGETFTKAAIRVVKHKVLFVLRLFRFVSFLFDSIIICAV